MTAKTSRSKISRVARAALYCGIFVLIGAPPVQCESLPTHHVRQAVASGEAQFLYSMPSTQTLSIDILLPARDRAGLEEFLREVNDPSSPIYRQFLTAAEFTGRFGPTQQDYDAVAAFAEANGMTVTDRWSNRLVLGVTGSVAAIQNTFHLKMGIYQHPTEERTFFAPDREPSVDLSVPLWHIGGLDNYSTPHPLYRKAAPEAEPNATGSGPGGSFLGSDRRAAYYPTLSLEGTGQSVGLFELDGYTLSDVQTYFTNVGQPLNVTINNVLVDGASGGSDGNDTEQVIDIIVAISMAPALSQVRVYIGPYSTFTAGKTDTDIFNKMATENITKQISCSWGWRPDDPGSVSQSGTNDYIFNEMESQGQNIFAASGDSGSYPNSTDIYYPAEDAYVVAVGGTILTTSSAGGPWESEVAWGTTTSSCPPASSGGGISPDEIPIPSYQKLSGVINSSNGGSTSYRNVPDVAAEANCDNYYCANGSCGNTLGGTSLAAPTWAGFMALVNQTEEANYSKTLGFLNSLIYPIGVGSNYDDDFHDITSGTNGAFDAVTGYDLVTGWGSMNGGCSLMTALAGSCPEPTASVSPTSLSLTSEDKQPASGQVTLSNNGPSPLFLVISSMSITGSSYFSVTGGNCQTKTEYPSPGSCTVQVTFEPVSCASASGVLYIWDNSTTGAQSVDLTGKVLNCKT